MHRHHRRAAQQTAHLHHIAHIRALHRDHAHGGGLAVHHTHRRLVGDDGRDRLGAGAAGYSDHVQSHGAHAGHGLQLVDGQCTVQRGGDHTLVLRHGDKRAGQAAHMAGRHNAALFHRVVQQRQRRRGTVGTADSKPHLLQNTGHAVAHRRGGGQRQIHDTKGRIQPL